MLLLRSARSRSVRPIIVCAGKIYLLISRLPSVAKLIYMPLRGLAEDIRLLLIGACLSTAGAASFHAFYSIFAATNFSSQHQSHTRLSADQGIEFEDVRIPSKEFAGKKWEINPHFGQVPVLEEGDQKYVQSKAILRHLARLHNLYGATEQDHYRADMVAEACADWRRKYTTLVYDAQFESKKQVFLADLPNILKCVASVLADHQYVLGATICFADYILYELIDITQRLDAPSIAAFATLVAFHQRFEQRPLIAAYLAAGKRPAAVNGGSSHFDGWREGTK